MMVMLSNVICVRAWRMAMCDAMSTTLTKCQHIYTRLRILDLVDKPCILELMVGSHRSGVYPWEIYSVVHGKLCDNIIPWLSVQAVPNHPWLTIKLPGVVAESSNFLVSCPRSYKHGYLQTALKPLSTAAAALSFLLRQM
jgi:hypothetical protein